MQHWCFNCCKITFPKAGMKCQYCSSEAIEEMRDENNPAQYIPFTVPAQPNSPPQAQEQPNDSQERRIITITFIRPVPLMMPPFLPMSFIRLLNLAGEEEQSSPVDDEKY